MKKFKFMSSRYADELERSVNYFVETHNVIDIQFQFQFSGATTKTYAVMIVYEE